MQPAILQCFEVGMHMLILLDVIGLAIGVGIQFLLHKKAKSRAGRWWFAAVNLIGMLVCDIAAQIITGWDLLIPLFLYWLFFTLFLGACVCILLLRSRSFLKSKRL